MQRLWAPWRSEYIASVDKIDGCIFCNVLKENQDEKNKILIRDKNCFAIMNKFPYNNGHLMIAPNAHVPDLQSIEKETLSEMMQLTCLCQKIIKETMNPDGFNVGINIGRPAGAGIVDHIHIHTVPRWNGDTNFMPVFGQTKIISQAMEDTYNLLMKKKKEIMGE